MKTAELEGAVLDYWVARAGVTEPARFRADAWEIFKNPKGELVSIRCLDNWCPSRDWSVGGPILDRESIATWKNGAEWRAQHPDHPDTGYYNIEDGSLDVSFYDGIAGSTPLIAAMRAFVASRFGDEVPDIKEKA